MRKMKAVAFIVACSMLIGQTAWAQEIEEVQEAAEEVQIDEVENVAKETWENESLENAEASTAEEAVPEQEEVEVSGESITEYEAFDERVAELENKTVYIDMPVRMNVQCLNMPWSYTIESSDSAICEVQILEAEQNNGKYYAYFTLIGKKEGKVEIKVCDREGKEESCFQVTVKVLPDDAVRFRDPMLIGHLLGNFEKKNSCDENKDGYITKEELGKVERFSLSIYNVAFDAESIKDLTGMENAVNATSVELAGNEALQDLSPIRNLEKLQYISLLNTDVSDEEKWELAAASIKDMNIKCGEIIKIPRIMNLLEEIRVSEIQNKEILMQRDSNSVNVFDQYIYSGIKSGRAVLEVSYKNYKKQIAITVSGTIQEQPVGTPVKNSIKSRWEYGKGGYGTLTENGEFWFLDNELEKFEKIATDIKRVSGTFILKSNGDLQVGWFEDHCVMQDVVDFVQDYPAWYILKKDGTLWRWLELTEGISDKDELEFIQIDTDVKAISSMGYMKNDGMVKTLYGEIKEENAEYINEVGYYTKSGNFYFWRYPKYDGSNLKIQAMTWVGGHYDATEGIGYDAVLTLEGEVWAYVEGRETPVFLGRNAEKLLNAPDADWMDREGNYYKYNRKLETSKNAPVCLESWNWGTGTTCFELMQYGTEKGGCLLKNGAEMLDYVKEILYLKSPDIAVVLRKDGTVWKIQNTPVMLGSIGDAYKKGDVNEDGQVNIEDLRIILRGVCGKIDLTEHQIQIADVEEDGKVDIQDLRKVLRFVCGKITEL